jgi:hypothetical protein
MSCYDENAAYLRRNTSSANQNMLLKAAAYYGDVSIPLKVGENWNRIYEMAAKKVAIVHSVPPPAR